MKHNILGLTAIAFSLLSLHAMAANQAVADKPVVKKTQAAADEESKRPETLKEFPQYNYPVATILPAEVVETKVIETEGPVVDAQYAPVSDK